MKNKQFKEKDWLYWFQKYETNNISWHEYYLTRNLKSTKPNALHNAKYSFKQKYLAYKNGNYNIIISMTGKSKKKKHPKKPIEPDWNTWSDEEKNEILRWWWRETNKDSKKAKMLNTRKINISVQKKAKFFNLSRSGIYKNLSSQNKINASTTWFTFNGFNSKGKESSWIIRRLPIRHNELWANAILSSFFAHDKIYGRVKICIDIKNNYGIIICEKTVGNYMKKLGLKCITRVARRKNENKNTKVKIPDLVQRNYNTENIIATDVTYIPVKSNKTNHAYLSIAINHKTKYIEGWSLSENNDAKLVYNTIQKIKPNRNLIIHSDHGSVYSSDTIQKLINQKKGKSSMSRIGNSLDNREAEYFFSIIKSEKLNHLDTKQMTFDKLKKVIAEYIEWYNNVRIQKKLNWKAPLYQKNQNSILTKINEFDLTQTNSLNSIL